MQLLALLPSSEVVGGAGGWKVQPSNPTVGSPSLGAFQNNPVNISSGVVERGLLMNNKRHSFPVYVPEIRGIPLILLCFTLLHFTDKCVFTNWRSVATCFKQVYQHHFSNSIGSLCASVSHFGNSRNISSFFIIIILVMVICDQWSLMLPF